MPKERTRSGRRTMTDEHKAALAKGREEGLAVRRYLEALESSKPKRGRKRTAASIDKKLASIDTSLATADPLTRLHLLQERKDLVEERGRTGDDSNLDEFETEFVRVASSYGDRKGISYATWRAAGVSAPVLQRAGIARTRG